MFPILRNSTLRTRVTFHPKSYKFVQTSFVTRNNLPTRISHDLMLAEPHIQDANWNAALPLLLLAAEKDHKRDKQITIHINRHLAFVYQNLYQPSKAIPRFLEAIELYKGYINLSNQDRIDYASTLINYAETLTLVKEVGQAIVEVQRAINILRKLGGPPHLLAAACGNLASYLVSEKRYAEALEPCRESLKLFSDTSGRFSNITRSSWSLLRLILEKLGKTEEADDLVEDWKAVDLSELKPGKHFTDIELDTFESAMNSNFKARVPNTESDLWEKELQEITSNMLQELDDDPEESPVAGNKDGEVNDDKEDPEDDDDGEEVEIYPEKEELLGEKVISFEPEEDLSELPPSYSVNEFFGTIEEDKASPQAEDFWDGVESDLIGQKAREEGMCKSSTFPY
eukprot:TRINITY_DN4112_c0_g2_i1.p1 TRINITY_DN4112_c0_g2~~TRINITY_DN4112_c0_g2_i1.p1  ORF type:complete len:413 (-),score=92.77 TRINITY_DN4112_c0_g2_i1:707-1903(-)